MITKLVSLASSGELSKMPDGAIVNIGGTSSTTFTVDNRALLFADGTSTAPGGPINLLQSVYDRSSSGEIELDPTKPFKLFGSTSSLEVTDTGVNIDSARILNLDIDFLHIVKTSFTTDVVKFGTTNSTFFKVDQNGITTIMDLQVGSVNFDDFYTEMQHHLTNGTHTAMNIDVALVDLPAVENVKEALEVLAADVKAIKENPSIKTHHQLVGTASSTWNIAHNKSSSKAIVSVFDDSNIEIIPDSIKIVDANNIEIKFITAQTGAVTIMCF